MHIKECYVSHNGISCFTNINSLINVKDIEFKSKINSFINKYNIFFFITLRLSEFIIKDFIKNKFYLFDSNYLHTDLLPNIMFS